VSRAIAALALAVMFAAAAGPQTPPASAFDRLKTLVGTWEADSPAGGTLTSTIWLVSKGTAIEEAIGTPQESEVSLYTADGDRIVMTHYCALTARGNQARLRTPRLTADQTEFVFSFVSITNLASPAEAHMRHVVLRLKDKDHLSEQWTKRENGKDSTFTLSFTRR
jgi:hypothetical protein